MSTHQGHTAVIDDFWTEHVQLFTGQLPSSSTTPQRILGKFT
jgi:hypothetical protein